MNIKIILLFLLVIFGLSFLGGRSDTLFILPTEAISQLGCTNAPALKTWSIGLDAGSDEVSDLDLKLNSWLELRQDEGFSNCKKARQQYIGLGYPRSETGTMWIACCLNAPIVEEEEEVVVVEQSPSNINTETSLEVVSSWQKFKIWFLETFKWF
jgi:hypothetical protein